MSDEPTESVAPVAADQAPPVAPPVAPTEPLTVATEPSESGVVGHAVGVVATRVEDDVNNLASHVEAEAQKVVESTYREIDALESAANIAPSAIAAHTVGLLHSDTITVNCEKIGNEGPRQEQIHTSLLPS